MSAAGPLTEYMFYFPGLRQLDVSSNQLVGTVPAYALMWVSNCSSVIVFWPAVVGCGFAYTTKDATEALQQKNRH
jgi:hypothetical protein